MTKRKDGRWQEKMMVNGKMVYFYGATKTEVNRKIREHKEIIDRGELFKTVAEEWWEQHAPTLSPNTHRSYYPALNRAISHFSDDPIKDITPQHISSYLTDFAAMGYANKTVVTQLLVINLIFKYAVSKGYAMFNMARDVTVPKGLAKTKRHAAPMDDMQKVMAHPDSEMGLLAVMAIYTGLRRGELLALTWDDIDIKERTISVTKSLYHINNKPYIKKPKTDESIGVVPILDALLPYLRPSKGLVFPGHDGGYYTYRRFETAWKKYQEEAGITSSLHQFRHSFATMLFESDVPPEKMQALLRHAQLSTTMDIYKDLRKEKLKSIHQDVYGVNWVSESR